MPGGIVHVPAGPEVKEALVAVVDLTAKEGVSARIVGGCYRIVAWGRR